MTGLFEDSILCASDENAPARNMACHSAVFIESEVFVILACFCLDGLLIWGVMLNDGLLEWRGAKCISREGVKQM